MTVTGREEQVAGELDAFESTLDPVALTRALQAIEAESSAAGTDPEVASDRTLDLWCALLTTVDRHLDAGWDPEDLPELQVIPPPAAGVAYPSGVTPSAVPDPAVRMEYEKALGEVRKKAEGYDFQLSLHRVDERAIAGLVQFLATGEASACADRLDAFLEGEASDALRERVRAALARSDDQAGGSW